MIQKNYLPAELAAQLLKLTSCDFVGDEGCTDKDCQQCHAPPKPLKPYATPQGAVVLQRLKEECAEVIQAVSKLERFGPSPSQYAPLGNQAALEKEIGQVLQLVMELTQLQVISFNQVKQHSRDYAERLAAEPHWIAPHVVCVPLGKCEHEYYKFSDDKCPSCGTKMELP